MQVAEEMGKITSSSGLSCQSAASVSGEGGRRDTERPEGFHVRLRGERGISQGTLKFREIFGSLNPFLKPWRLLSQWDAPAAELSAVRWGQGARAPPGGTGWIGKG